MKKTFALLLATVISISAFSVFIPASASSAADIPANSAYVDQSLTGANGTKVEFTNGGVKYSAEIGKTAFTSVSDALAAVTSGGTVYLAAGTYSTGVTIDKDVTILGPKAGINPNVKGKTATDEWTRSSDRGDGEAILTTSWHLGINAGSAAVYDAKNITIDGIMISGAGMLRSNYGAAGECNITVKNILVSGYTTNGNGPFFFLPYYPDKSTNNYIRNVVAENIRFEGQTTAPGFYLTVQNFEGKGICFDSKSSKTVMNYVTVPSSGAAKGKISVSFTDCMFAQNSSQVLCLDFSKNAGGYPFNSTIGDFESVTATVKNCVFICDDAYKAGVIVTKSETDNVKFDVADNTFASAGTVEAGTVDDTHYDLDKEVRFFGRTYVSGGVHYFNWSASGFTFRFEGTDATAVFKTNNPDSSNTAYIKVYIDGVEQPDVALTQGQQTVKLASGLAKGTHEITVRKRTNARSSSAGVIAIAINDGGKKLTPSAAKETYIEFVGDSLTVGYASVAGSATAWSTSTEDATKTYAPAIADALNADYGVIAISGRGIGRNYGGDTDKLIPELYEYTDEYNLPGVKWNFSYTPDVIVVNMGTNDALAICKEYQKTDFQAAYVAFIKQLRAHYADTKILCVYCLTDMSLHKYVKAAVEELNAAGDDNVAYLKLTTAGTDTTLGHPTQAGYAKNVDIIVAAINDLLSKSGSTETEAVTTAEVTTEEEVTAEQTAAVETTAPETEPSKKSGCGAAMSGIGISGVCAAAVAIVKKKN